LGGVVVGWGLGGCCWWLGGGVGWGCLGWWWCGFCWWVCFGCWCVVFWFVVGVLLVLWVVGLWVGLLVVCFVCWCFFCVFCVFWWVLFVRVGFFLRFVGGLAQEYGTVATRRRFDHRLGR
ncbi:hypothetical protein RA277_28200, partial [Pseudomonas syringae pv. tagetis]